jgi:ABC-type uncharacterized transport system permease subunit
LNSPSLVVKLTGTHKRTARMNPAYFGLGASLLYLIGTAIQGSTIKHETAAPRAFHVIVLGAFGLHAGACYAVMAQPQGVDLGLFAVASLTFSILGLALYVSSLRVPIGNLFLVVLPLSAASVIASVFYPGTPIAYREFSGGLLGHVLLSILAYTVLLCAAAQSVALSVQEHALKARRSMSWLRLLPPLQSMETLLFQLLWIGFALLTLAIGSGFVYLDDMFAQRVVHHTVLALASWVTFVILLLGRFAFGWRGTTAARWTMVGFALLVIGYFGSKLVLEIILGGG